MYEKMQTYIENRCLFFFLLLTVLIAQKHSLYYHYILVIFDVSKFKCEYWYSYY